MQTRIADLTPIDAEYSDAEVWEKQFLLRDPCRQVRVATRQVYGVAGGCSSDLLNRLVSETVQNRFQSASTHVWYTSGLQSMDASLGPTSAFLLSTLDWP